MTKNGVCRILLAVYATSSVGIAAVLALGLPGTGDLSGTTSGHILSAAILALAFGAARAVRDPWESRVVVQVIIAFTAMATVMIAAHAVAHSHGGPDRAWVLVPLSLACPLLFAVFYPTPSGDGAGEEEP
ncbi:MAG TPA: hypothetical protein PLE63_08070 [Thermoleophilia bacterium]|jgi:hypothetical protein|nr:hypothetical protein [Thermoleophilia bacterium]